MAKAYEHPGRIWLRTLIIAVVMLMVGTACAGAPVGAPAAGGSQAEEHGAQGTAEPPAHDMRKVFPEVEEIYDKVEADGVLIEFTIKAEDSFLGPKTVEESGLATVKFRLTTSASGEPVTNTIPKAWIDRAPAPGSASSEAQPACEQRVAGYLHGTLIDRPEIDLNSFFILSLNNEASVSVIDPLVNLAGITQLYAMLELPKPGEDWALSQDQAHLFISVPEAGQVAAADMSNFQVTRLIDTGGVPVQVAFQPDERYVWVGNDSTDEGGVVVIDPAALEVVARIATGAGHHAIAFSADSRYAFVTSEKAGTLTVIDTQSLEKVKDVRTGPLPVAVEVSALNQAIYVANGENGAITVLDGSDFEPRASLQAAPGLYALRFTPDGRWGFVSNPRRNEVYILDAANDRLAHTLTVDGAPDQISFSQTAAYLRSFDKPQAGIVQLADLGKPELPPVTTVVYGTVAPRQSRFQSVADAIFPAARQQAMLVASPAEGLIYYYIEGAASPSGNFQGYGRVPRAVSVVDRGFRQEAPGIYSARFRVPESGDFVVALLLDEPRVVHCFQFTAKPNSAAETGPASAPPELTMLTEARQFKAGEEFRLQFTLRDPTTQTALADLNDVVVLVVQTGGNWNQRLAAEHLGDGVYEMRFTVPQPGFYTMFFSIPSANIGLDQLPQWTVEVVK